MYLKSYISKNWLTQKISPMASTITLILVFLLILLSVYYWTNSNGKLLTASYEQVYHHKDYWRLWTSLFIHADFLHLASNLFLFIPFAYFLTGFYSWWFFPLSAFIIGGFLNALVLLSLPVHVTLMGVSGVVYWMGASWMLLAFLIDKRESKKLRGLRLLAVTLMLFMPDTYQPQISYLSHGVGFILGLITSSLYFHLQKEVFKKQEIIAFKVVNDDYFPEQLEDFHSPP
jgi:rhomboid protease GluP